MRAGASSACVLNSSIVAGSRLRCPVSLFRIRPGASVRSFGKSRQPGKADVCLAEKRGVRYQTPERPERCFAFLVSDTNGTNLGCLSEPRALAVGLRRILTTFSSPTASARGSKPVPFVSDTFFPTMAIKSLFRSPR